MRRERASTSSDGSGQQRHAVLQRSALFGPVDPLAVPAAHQAVLARQFVRQLAEGGDRALDRFALFVEHPAQRLRSRRSRCGGCASGCRSRRRRSAGRAGWRSRSAAAIGRWCGRRRSGCRCRAALRRTATGCCRSSARAGVILRFPIARRRRTAARVRLLPARQPPSKPAAQVDAGALILVAARLRLPEHGAMPSRASVRL